MAGLGGEPLTVLVGRMLGHGNRRKAIFTHAEAHFHVRLGRMRDGVRHLIEVCVELFGSANPTFLVEVHEEFKLVPRDLAGSHPEGGDFDLTLRALVVIPAIFTVGASHEETSAWDGHEVEGDVRAGDAFRVGLHLLFADRFRVPSDAFVDGCDEFRFINGLHLLNFPGDEFEVVRPLSAFLNPLFDEVGFLLGKRAALLFWGHHEVIIRVEDHGRVDKALVRLSGDEGITAFTAFEGLCFGVHSETTFGISFAMAADAVLLENGLDILHEVDGGGGRQDGCERYGEGEGALGRFHGDESIR